MSTVNNNRITRKYLLHGYILVVLVLTYTQLLGNDNGNVEKCQSVAIKSNMHISAEYSAARTYFAGSP